MAENYKHLYELMKKMVEKYQDEIVPGLRKVIADLESSRVEVVHCRDCKYRKTERCQMYWESEDGREQYNWETDDDFCSSGKRRDEHSWKR